MVPHHEAFYRLFLIDGIYKDLQKEGWSIELLKRYRVDYIIWDRKAQSQWDIEEYKELELVERLGDVFIYRLTI